MPPYLAYLLGSVVAAVILSAVTGYLMEHLRTHVISFCAIALLCVGSLAFLSPFGIAGTVLCFIGLVFVCGIVRVIAFVCRWHIEATRDEEKRLEPC